MAASKRGSREPTSEKTAGRRHVRFVPLAILAGSLLVGILTIHFVHGWQVRSHADAYLERAHEAIDAGELDDAAQDLQRYLQLRPGDNDALALFGKILADTGRFGPAYGVLERVLIRDPNRDDSTEIRRRLIAVAVQLGQQSGERGYYLAALDQVRKLPTIEELEAEVRTTPPPPEASSGDRAASPWQRVLRACDDAELLVAVARCHTGLEEHELAAAALRSAIEADLARLRQLEGRPDEEEAENFRKDPRRVAPFRLLVESPLYDRSHPAPAGSAQGEEDSGDPLDHPDNVMQLMVSRYPDSVRARVTRGEYLLRSADRHRRDSELHEGLVNQAAEEAALTMKLAPDDPAGAFLAAKCALAKGELEKARELAVRSVKNDPDFLQTYAVLADVEGRTGNTEEAIQWLRRGLELSPGYEDLLWNLANLLLDRGDTEEARQIVRQLKRPGRSQPQVTFLEGRLLHRDERWLEASRQYETARKMLVDRPELVGQIDVYLGYCYGELERWDQAISAFQRAVDGDPLWIAPRLGLARALRIDGRQEEALAEYRRIVQLEAAPASVWLDLAALLVARNRRIEDPDWDEVTRIIDAAEKAAPDRPDVPLLRADIRLANNQPDEAERLLLQVRETRPHEVVFDVALVDLARQRGDWDRTERYVAEAEQRHGDTVALRNARARYLYQRFRAEATDRVAALAEPPSGWDDAEVTQLWSNLADLALAVGDTDQARRLYSRVAETQPHDLYVRLLLFDLALNSQDPSGVEATLDEIRTIEGEGPLWRYGEALRLALLAEKSQSQRDVRQHTEDALAHLAKAAAARPNWSRIPMLVGRLLETRGETNKAIENYKRAIDLGGRNLNLVRRTVALLNEQRRSREVSDLFSRLEEGTGPQLRGLGRLGVDAALALNDLDLAWQRAERSAVYYRDYRDDVWLGEILARLAEIAEAEGKDDDAQRFRRRAEESLRRPLRAETTGQEADAARQDPRTWTALIGFLARRDRIAEAEQSLAEAKEHIPAADQPLALAYCCEMIGQVDEAALQYQAALRGGTFDPAIARQAADFYARRGNFRVAERLFRRLVEAGETVGESDVTWGRRNLATILMMEGAPDNLQEALRLIRLNTSSPDASADDRVTEAMILARFPSTGRREEAIHVFERALRQPGTVTTPQRFQLARLYAWKAEEATRRDATAEARTAWERYRRQMLQILSADDVQPNHVAHYVEALLQQENAREAERWVDYLNKHHPKDPTAAILRARLAFERGRLLALEAGKPEDRRAADEYLDRGISILKAFVDDSESLLAEPVGRVKSASEVLEGFADRLEESAQRSRAGRIRETARQIRSSHLAEHPEDGIQIAAFEASRGRQNQALGILEGYWQHASAEELGAQMPLILPVPAATEEQLRRGEAILLAACQEHGRPPVLLHRLAEVDTYRGRQQEAEEIYREILGQNADDTLALNNLAILLALQGKQLDMAMDYIDRAIVNQGERPALLDSRAVVRLAAGRNKEARADAEKVLATDPNPVTYFHQSQILDRLGRTTAARDAFASADGLGLTPQMLHPLELPAYEALLGKFKPN